MKLEATLVVLLLLLAVALLVLWKRWRRLARAEYIRAYTLPVGLLDRLAKRRPELSFKERALVAHALRQYFLAYLLSGKRFVSMPSQVADDLWHEFILYTRNYQDFCSKAFGGYFHHTPAVALGADQRDNSGLRRTWWHCCREENINPRRPSRLPLLFALDAKLGIADGFRYAPECSSLRQGGDGAIYCGGDFSSGDFAFGESDISFSSDISDSGGDSSGCGGGGGD
jgi:hypothetical protein